MASMDDGLLLHRSTMRRDPSQRILAGIDDGSRWQTMLFRPWTMALAVVAPGALFLAAMLLMPAESLGGLRRRGELAPVPVPRLIAEAPVVAPLKPFVPPPSIAVAPLRVLLHTGTAHADPSVTVRRKKRRAATSMNEDVALLSVLVEHIDAERRKRTARTPTN